MNLAAPYSVLPTGSVGSSLATSAGTARPLNGREAFP